MINQQDIPVILIQPQLVHVHDIQRKISYFLCDRTVIFYLGKIRSLSLKGGFASLGSLWNALPVQ